MTPESEIPTPTRLFQTLNAYQQSAALRGAIELELFTAIAEGHKTTAELAQRCVASERGLRILCNTLVVYGFLTKHDNGYSLSAESAPFLDRRSPAYLGGVVRFLLSPTLTRPCEDVAALVRRGSTTLTGEGAVDAENPLWVDFARGMGALMRLPAQRLVGFTGLGSGPAKLLDLAAGHGLFGITCAEQHPDLEVYAVDWPAVLAVAEENARLAGVQSRFHKLPGSAFEIEFGSGYEVILLTNFLHHFDPPTNTRLLQKIAAALAPGGRLLTLEVIPNPDRVSPPHAVTFALQMLASTPAGDAYTFAELEHMLRGAGFTHNELHDWSPMLNNLIVSTR